MTSATERLSVVEAQAFGVPFAFLDCIDASGLSTGRGAADAVQTTVRHDPAGVQANWIGARPRRTREIWQGDRLVLSVDHDDERGYLLHAVGVGSALITADGLEVRCAPEPGGVDWPAVLVGQVLPIVATLRGLEVFHASGVVVNGRAHMLAGVQGMGKTSLATHLVMAGAELLSDDVVAVDDRLLAHPGTTFLKLREPERRRLPEQRIPRLQPLGDLLGRARFAAAAASDPQPLGGVHLLQRTAAGPTIERVEHPSPFELLGATFNLSVQTPVRLVRQLELCSQIAHGVPVFRVRIRPDQGASEVARAILAHVTAPEPHSCA